MQIKLLANYSYYAQFLYLLLPIIVFFQIDACFYEHLAIVFLLC